MSNESICVFCGEKTSTFRSALVQCGDTWQFACKKCEREVRNLDESERCRRALMRGLAEQPDLLRERIQLIAEAEKHRPVCLRCGEKLRFGEEQRLDNSYLGDGLLKDSFEIIPAWCDSCGKMEFYHPQIVKKNRYMAYLIEMDGAEQK